jgi:hypothetical protein
MSNLDVIKAARQAAIIATGEVLKRMGLEPEFISYSDIKKLYGRKLADNARRSETIEWFPGPRKGQGNMAFCKRSAFREFLFDKCEDVKKSFSIIN